MMLKKIAMIVLALFVLGMAASCRHTAHGFGEDVEQMGKKIKEKTD
jgi:predicted small secreted protein